MSIIAFVVSSRHCRLPALAFSLGTILVCAASAADKPPNFVFILIDDLGWRDLGCYGSTFYEAPNLDSLAGSGMRFTSAYAACPVCSPTRASIQTGKYPARLHTTDYFGGPQPEQAAVQPRFKNRKLLPAPYVDRLSNDEVTIAEVLKKAGYATFFAGKWHLGPKGSWPDSHGYDVNKGGWRGGSPASYFSPYANPTLSDGPPGEHLDTRLALETADFIAAHADHPFFAFLSLYDVHIPLQAQPDLKAKYADKAKQVHYDGARDLVEGQSHVRQVQDHPTYAAMVEMMDRAVGTVLNSLSTAGVADRTVVIFTSDNGGLSTAEGAPTSNVPLRAGKGWMYEGGIRVPLIIRWPGVTKPASVCDQYIISTDYYPTILEMASLPPHAEQHRDGKSFASLLRGGTHFDRGPIFWHYPHYGNQGGSPAAAIRDGGWKLIEFFEESRVELYHLTNDVSEQHDFANSEPERAAAMLAQLHRWRKSTGAAMTSPNSNFRSN
jgi:arylsulfatase A-like enzyme